MFLPLVQGAILTVTPAPDIIAQNIAAGVSNQTLGGYIAEVTEPIAVKQHDMLIHQLAGITNAIVNAVIVDANNTIVAGPFDSQPGPDGSETIRFTDTIMYLPGRHKYAIKGKISSRFPNNGTFYLETNPAFDWHGGIGLTTGILVDFENRAVKMSTMTVKKGALSVSVTSEADREIVAGTLQVVGLKVRLDTTASAESTRTTVVPLLLTFGDGAKPSDIQNVRLYDATIPLNTGSNVLNPTQESVQLFMVDGTGVISPVGTTREIILRFNLATSAIGTFQWSVPTNLSEMYTTGLLTAQKVTPTIVGNVRGPVLTVIKAQHAKFISLSAGNGKIEMHAIVQPGYRYWLEWTTDFKLWNRETWLISNNATGEWAGSMNWQDGKLTAPQRFFRIVAD